MNPAFDDRLVSLSITLADGTTISYDQRFFINAVGKKYANSNLADCAVQIDNIDREVRNNIITQTSPLNVNRLPVVMTLLAGRVSTGTFVLYQGNVVASGPTQPPDIGLRLQSLSQALQLVNPVNLTMPATSNLSTISQQVANQLGLKLDFRATDKQVENYAFTGGALKQVGKIQDAGDYVVFVDNDTLVVMDQNRVRNDTPVEINADTGMVGVPEITETGVRVRVLITNELRMGDAIRVTSKINPAANGVYRVFILNFEIASREPPFYWVIDAQAERYFLAG